MCKVKIAIISLVVFAGLVAVSSRFTSNPQLSFSAAKNHTRAVVVTEPVHLTTLAAKVAE